VFLIGLVLGVVGSFILDRKLHVRQPDVLPFKWGYFNGIMAAVWLPVAALALLIPPLPKDRDTYFLSVFCLLGIGIAGVFVLKRSRAAFLFLTLVSLNPIGWLINGIYLSHRWQELDPKKTPQSGRAIPDANATDRAHTHVPAEPIASQRSAAISAPSSQLRPHAPLPTSGKPLVSYSPSLIKATSKAAKVPSPIANIYLAENGRKDGPFTSEQIVKRLRNSPDVRSQMYWQPGMDAWRPMHELSDKLQRTGALS